MQLPYITCGLLSLLKLQSIKKKVNKLTYVTRYEIIQNWKHFKKILPFVFVISFKIKLHELKLMVTSEV